MILQKQKLKRYVFIIMSLIIATTLILPSNVLWAVDRSAYLYIYAMDSASILKNYFNTSIVSVIANEPLFLIINIILLKIMSPENIIRTIIFISTILTLYSLGRLTKYNLFIVLIFIIFPPILKNYTIHLRQGLALAIYIFGISFQNKMKNIRYLSVFIHTSSAFIIIFEIIDYIFKKLKYKYDLKIFKSIIVIYIMTSFIPTIAMIIGDRRTLEYDFEGEMTIGLGFIIWLLCGILFIINMDKNKKINILVCYGIIFYIVGYFKIDFAARVFESIIPLMMVAILTNENRKIRYKFIVFFIIYGIIMYTSGIFQSWIA